MGNNLFTIKYILIAAGVIIVDLAVYFVLGLFLMNYDDFYDESKGEYWSWDSMSQIDKIVVVALDIWNVTNILAICYFIFKVIKRMKLRATTTAPLDRS